MPRYVPVAQLADVPPNGALQVLVGEEQVAIVACGPTLYAVDNICSHAYAELHEGFVDGDDCSIECPLHGARFDLASGRALSLPATQPIKTYQLKVEDETIFLALED